MLDLRSVRRRYHRAMQVTLIAVSVLLAIACSPGPSSPSAAVPATRWVDAGQSNALNLGPFLQAVHPDTIVTAESGQPIAYWNPDAPGWRALEPQLRASLQAVIWFQGESDWDGVADVPPPGYEAALRNLIARMRQTNGNPHLLVVICGLVARYVPAIGTAQLAVVASDRDTIYVRSDDLPNDGSVHLYGEGLPMMARRIADAIAARQGR